MDIEIKAGRRITKITFDLVCIPIGAHSKAKHLYTLAEMTVSLITHWPFLISKNIPLSPLLRWQV
jgi:hypothetical protein